MPLWLPFLTTKPLDAKISRSLCKVLLLIFEKALTSSPTFILCLCFNNWKTLFCRSESSSLLSTFTGMIVFTVLDSAKFWLFCFISSSLSPISLLILLYSFFNNEKLRESIHFCPSPTLKYPLMISMFWKTSSVILFLSPAVIFTGFPAHKIKPAKISLALSLILNFNGSSCGKSSVTR